MPGAAFNTVIMDSIKMKMERKVADVAVRKVFKAFKADDPAAELVKLVNLAEKLSGHIYNPNSFEYARQTVSDMDSRWMRSLTRGFRDVDEHIIYQNVMNVAYQTGVWGIRQKVRLQKERGTNIPSIILMDPTSACNMKCKGCWAAEYGHQYNLSYETLCDIVDQGRDIGVFIYLMTGGEPLVRKADILKLAAKYQDCAFHIFTNGSLIDDDFCEEVRKLGNITFAISLEGFEDENDARRGEGCFQQVLATMDRMHRHKLLYGCSVCYTSKNFETVTSDQFLKLLTDHGCFLVWYFHYMPVGSDAVPELMLTPDQRKAMIERIRYLRHDDSKHDIFFADFQNDGQFVGGCIAGGKNYLHINAKGDIEPCVFIHYSDVNIHDVSLLDAMKSPLFMAYHEGQPFNHNHLRPCPMLENPELLKAMVHKTGSKSTDYASPESVDDLCARCEPYAANWKPSAEAMWDEYGPEHVNGRDEHRQEVAERQEARQEAFNQRKAVK